MSHNRGQKREVTRMDFLARLFSDTDFMPRLQCGLWTASLVKMHTFSDSVIALSYLLIPFTLYRAYSLYCQKRLVLSCVVQHLPHMLTLYMAFILLCGWTHLNNVIVFWRPFYRLFGIISLLTAVVSGATVFSMIWIIGTCALPKSKTINKGGQSKEL